jgi:hypothetical protein
MAEQVEEMQSGEGLSGVEVIEDLAGRLIDGLRDNCYLLATDSYQSYAATVMVEIQLHDVDRQTVTKKLIVGDPDPGLPSRRIAVDVPTAPAREVRTRSNLPTPPSLERDVTGIEPAREKRFYTPRAKPGPA